MNVYELLNQFRLETNMKHSPRLKYALFLSYMQIQLNTKSNAFQIQNKIYLQAAKNNILKVRGGKGYDIICLRKKVIIPPLHTESKPYFK